MALNNGITYFLMNNKKTETNGMMKERRKLFFTLLGM
jgi:hypothetical protein